MGSFDSNGWIMKESMFVPPRTDVFMPQEASTFGKFAIFWQILAILHFFLF